MNKRRSITAAVMFAIFAIYTVAVKTVDVQAIGPMGSKVGFASVNGMMHEELNVSMLCVQVSDILGYLALALVAFFGLFGLWQLVRRRSLLKVDHDILALGGLYAVVLAFYIFFEKVVINYRPVILEEGLEASYPSSHTMLAVCVLLSAALQAHWRIKDDKPRNAAKAVCCLWATLLVELRFKSGIHWFTDIVGGLLLSLALVYSYYAVVKGLRNE